MANLNELTDIMVLSGAFTKNNLNPTLVMAVLVGLMLFFIMTIIIIFFLFVYMTHKQVQPQLQQPQYQQPQLQPIRERFINYNPYNRIQENNIPYGYMINIPHQYNLLN